MACGRSALGLQLQAVGFKLRTGEFDAQPLAYGGFYRQALELYCAGEGERVAELGGGEAQRGGDSLWAVRGGIVQLHLARYGAVGDFSTTAKVIDHGAVSLDLVADAQAWRWPVILSTQCGHDLEPVCFALTQNIGGLFHPVAADKPKSDVVPLCGLDHQKIPEGIAWCGLGKLGAQALALLRKLLIEPGQGHGLGHFGNGDSGEFFRPWCGRTNLHQLGFMLRSQALAGQGVVFALRVAQVGFDDPESALGLFPLRVVCFAIFKSRPRFIFFFFGVGQRWPIFTWCVTWRAFLKNSILCGELVQSKF